MPLPCLAQKEESATLNGGISMCRQEKKMQKNHLHSLKEPCPSLSPQCVRIALTWMQALYPALSSLKSSAFSSLLSGFTSLLDRMEFASQEVKECSSIKDETTWDPQFPSYHNRPNRRDKVGMYCHLAQSGEKDTHSIFTCLKSHLPLIFLW